ncbi:MAG: hypothetical protein HY208_02900 [Nitrospirae bacterium]|nr:hypothetical protein [Nitrospirota bacterium]
MTKPKGAISIDEFIERYKALHDAIFKQQCYLPDFPFINQTWQVALLPYGELKFSDIDFYALMQAAQSGGDQEIIITDVDTLPIIYQKPVLSPHRKSVKIYWNKEDLDRLSHEIFFGHFDAHVFGCSGTWGVVSYWDNCFCVGGSPAFMDVFIRKAGGMQALKERFLDYANNIWEFGSEDVKKKTLALAGWY